MGININIAIELKKKKKYLTIIQQKYSFTVDTWGF